MTLLAAGKVRVFELARRRMDFPDAAETRFWISSQLVR
jgi:hypothetical protein